MTVEVGRQGCSDVPPICARLYLFWIRKNRARSRPDAGAPSRAAGTDVFIFTLLSFEALRSCPRRNIFEEFGRCREPLSSPTTTPPPSRAATRGTDWTRRARPSSSPSPSRPRCHPMTIRLADSPRRRLPASPRSLRKSRPRRSRHWANGPLRPASSSSRRRRVRATSISPTSISLPRPRGR